ncbi:MAG TPA: GGDEF domain-containing protein [Cyanobacteria bacterium UBA11149]|nr:GGDEF domain-containing protein [Cyanobacteria bacterium UBA11367]HBW91177.1 GGDEF domain-containing protein [Cyanobacteria bacterium UBA11149]
MDASVLVVANQQFLSKFLDLIHHIVMDKVEVSSDPEAVLSWVQTRQSAVLILQATQPGSLELCRKIKENSHWGWIYSILVNDRSEAISGTLLPDLCQELAAQAAALEGGADAYLQLTPAQTGDPIVLIAEHRLLKAQIQAGLRGGKFYHKLQESNDVLATMALADPLTDLNNRRAMEWELPRQIQHARTTSTSMSLILLDIDYFKSVKDTYGHQISDRLLQVVASRLQHNLRIQDTLFRYGGEEFLIVLSQTNIEESQIVAKRLQKIIADQNFNIEGKLVLQMTVSVGIATLNSEDDRKGESLMKRADRNLLLAKSSGRNQIFGGE